MHMKELEITEKLLKEEKFSGKFFNITIIVSEKY